jgi:choline-sulfatase
MGCAGHAQIQTPNLDRIAREGMRFSQAVTVSPLCMPARISFAGGRYPHNHGVWGNKGSMPENEPNFFHALQRAGYFTALVGKAHYYQHRPGVHLKEREAYMHACGFEHVRETTGPAAAAQTASWVTDEWDARGLWEDLQRDYAERRNTEEEIVRPSTLAVADFLDSRIGSKAAEFVHDYTESRPMCLFVGFGGPHEPWDAPGEYATMYRPEQTPPPIPIPSLPQDSPGWVTGKRAFASRPASSLALVPQIRANYYGKISLIDHQVGQILEAFRQKRWLDELLVIFLSDHGEMLGDHGRLRKGTFHESTVRIPLLIRWPGRVPANTATEALVENIDVLPTVIEAAGCSPLAGSMGRSLWPTLRHPAEELKDNQLSEIDHHIMLRTRQYKLAIDRQSRVYMLYDLERDPDEQSNLAGNDAADELASKLRRDLDGRLERSDYSVRRDKGFTLIELSIALVLLALMASTLYGSLSLAGTSWDRGEAKAQQTGEMRLTEDFLRRTLTSQHPLRLQKVVEKPLYFAGTRDSLSYAAALPGRAGAGMYYFRVAVTPNGDKSRLTLSRAIPDYAAQGVPDFSGADFSVLADNIREAHFGYFGRDPGAADIVNPTWRDRWDDPQRLPDLIRIDVTSASGAPWPTLFVEPRLAPEIGCPTWNAAARRCV